MAEYIEIPFSGRLRGVTYEDGKVKKTPFQEEE